MEWIMNLITNKILISTAIAWTIAQVLKIINKTVRNGFSVEVLTSSGGMPSSHSATVVSLAAACGIEEGSASAAFVVAVFLGIIVIYDALNVRLEAGKHAEILNRLNEERKQEGKTPLFEKPLKTSIGHTFAEIVAGIIIGVAVACIVCLCF